MYSAHVASKGLAMGEHFPTCLAHVLAVTFFLYDFLLGYLRLLVSLTDNTGGILIGQNHFFCR